MPDPLVSQSLDQFWRTATRRSASHPFGWPHFAVLDASDVRSVADDLATVTERDVYRWLESTLLSNAEDEKSYVMESLGRAQELTALRSSKNCAIISMIG